MKFAKKKLRRYILFFFSLPCEPNTFTHLQTMSTITLHMSNQWNGRWRRAWKKKKNKIYASENVKSFHPFMSYSCALKTKSNRVNSCKSCEIYGFTCLYIVIHCVVVVFCKQSTGLRTVNIIQMPSVTVNQQLKKHDMAKATSFRFEKYFIFNRQTFVIDAYGFVHFHIFFSRTVCERIMTNTKAPMVQYFLK